MIGLKMYFRGLGVNDRPEILLLFPFTVVFLNHTGVLNTIHLRRASIIAGHIDFEGWF